MKQFLIVTLSLILASQLALNATNPPTPAPRPRGVKREDVKQEVPEKDKTVYIQKPIPEKGWFHWDTFGYVIGSIVTGIAVGHFWPRNQKSS